MSSGITEDDRERIASFCETPSHARSPDDLIPDRRDDRPTEETPNSLLNAVWQRLRR